MKLRDEKLARQREKELAKSKGPKTVEEIPKFFKIVHEKVKDTFPKYLVISYSALKEEYAKRALALKDMFMADKHYKKYFKILINKDTSGRDKFDVLGFRTKAEMETTSNFRVIWNLQLLKGMLPNNEHMKLMFKNLKNWLPPRWELFPPLDP